jgi:hypothetical protein
MPQTRNLFDHLNFESLGTQRFNEDYAHIYNTIGNQPTQPQPTQEILQNLLWIQASNEFGNSSWAHAHSSKNSTSVHGGEGRHRLRMKIV